MLQIVAGHRTKKDKKVVVAKPGTVMPVKLLFGLENYAEWLVTECFAQRELGLETHQRKANLSIR